MAQLKDKMAEDLAEARDALDRQRADLREAQVARLAEAEREHKEQLQRQREEAQHRIDRGGHRYTSYHEKYTIVTI